MSSACLKRKHLIDSGTAAWFLTSHHHWYRAACPTTHSLEQNIHVIPGLRLPGNQLHPNKSLLLRVTPQCLVCLLSPTTISNDDRNSSFWFNVRFENQTLPRICHPCFAGFWWWFFHFAMLSESTSAVLNDKVRSGSVGKWWGFMFRRYRPHLRNNETTKSSSEFLIISQTGNPLTRL